MKAPVAFALLAMLAFSCEKPPAAPAGAPQAETPASGKIVIPEEKNMLVYPQPPAPVAPGQAAELFFSFEPRPKIKVPQYPPAYVEQLEGTPEVPLPEGRHLARKFSPGEEEEAEYKYYEGAPPPIRLEVQIPEGTPPGSYPFRGEVKYFFCYETGGICAQEKAPVEGLIEVVGPAKVGGKKP